jgi:hypothetical protein
MNEIDEISESQNIGLKNIELINKLGNQTSRKHLEKLNLQNFDSILILADEELEASENAFDMVNADSRSLTTLLLIREILGTSINTIKDGSNIVKRAAIISEILDPRTKPLINCGASSSDYVTSNELVSI